MNPSFRIAFGVLCLAAMIAVATGAFLEIGRARRAAAEAEGLLGADKSDAEASPGAAFVGANQFRLRMLSAVVWIIVPGSLAYATMFLWPTPGDSVTARRFLAVVSGAVLLIFIGLVLLAYDMLIVARRRRLQEQLFERQLNALAQAEIDRLALQNRTNPEPPASP